jgi:hypothetical protein
MVYMGDFSGPEETNDTCQKIMHVKVMGSGFSVLC